ncbi:MAG: cation-efflux pump [Clostridiales bacterium]|nr:cation-efflux pump [Clostridiales bacterium]
MKAFISLFLKDCGNYKDQGTRKRIGTFGSLTGLICNLILALMKILLGIICAAVSVTADGFNNLSDAGGSLIALITVRMAQKPYDEDHPFGHGRIEYIGAMAVGVLIIVFAVELIKSAVESIMNPVFPDISVLIIILLVLAILMKLFLWRLYGWIGTNTDNPTMTAASADSISDVLATSAVLVSMIVVMLLGEKLPWLIYLDGIMGIIVALLVFKAGFSVLKETVDRLLGGKPDRETGEKIIKKMLSYDGILGVHDFVLHDYGPGRSMASVHAEVSADCNIVEIHEVIDRAEMEIAREYQIPLCVHLDPIVTGDEETEQTRKQMQDFLSRMDPPLKLHDFRRVPGENRINLIFDVLLAPGQTNESELLEKITAHAKELDQRHHCVIHFDRDYFYISNDEQTGTD